MRDASGNAPGAQGGHGREAPTGTEPATVGLPWLLPHKVAVPDPAEGYLERKELEARCALTERRLTVLHAPGGFGKTALRARCCRALRVNARDGIPRHRGGDKPFRPPASNPFA